MYKYVYIIRKQESENWEVSGCYLNLKVAVMAFRSRVQEARIRRLGTDIATTQPAYYLDKYLLNNHRSEVNPKRCTILQNTNSKGWYNETVDQDIQRLL